MEKVVIAKKLQKVLKKIDSPVSKQLLEAQSTDIQYLGLSKQTKGYISYIAPEKLNRYGKFHKWNSSYRVHGKPARVASKLVQASDQDLEKFHNEFIALTLDSDKDAFKILSGDKIKWAYYRDNYYSDDGSIGCSCMRGRCQQDYFGIYTDNPDHVGLAVKFEEEKIAARCLVWYPKTKKDQSVKYFDRIYAYDSATEAQLHNWLVTKGFLQISDKNTIKPSHEIPSIRIELKNLDFEYYPYMDTLIWINDKDLNNCEDGDELSSTEGDRYRHECDRCGRRVGNEDDLHRIEAGGHEGENHCENCCSYSDVHGGWLCNDESWYCDYENTYILRSERTRLYNGLYCYEEHGDLQTSEEGLSFICGDSNFVEVEGCYGYYKYDNDNLEQIEDIYYFKGSPEHIEKLREIEEQENVVLHTD